MKKIFTKLLVAVALFSTTGLGIIANEANPSSSINGLVFRDTRLDNLNQWYYLTDGKAYAYHPNGKLNTKGIGNKNHYFYVYVRAVNGGKLAYADASNGKEAIAQCDINVQHSHTCSGALMP